MSQGDLTKGQKAVYLSPQEVWLIGELRKYPFGKAEITMTGGQPERLELIRESVKYVAT